MVVILQKMIMTGAMCVVAQGSSVQLLIAILVMLMYMLLGKKNLFCLYCMLVVSFVLNFLCSCLFSFFAVLKTAPFEADSEDWSAFVACVALTLTTIGGFALIMDDPTTRTYESAVLAVILIGINVFCIAIEILIVVFVDCGAGERCQRCCRGGGDKKTGNNSKVLPMTMEKQSRIDAAAEKAWEA
jgi:hypothetical protein